MKTLVVVVAVLAVDQLTKQVAIHSVEPEHPVEVMFGIEITNVRNDGVAFGLLSGGGGLILAITLVALVALYGFFYLRPDRYGLWLAVGLLSGGALANLGDRLRRGEVTDFIDFPFWPTFNLADVAIVAGAGILALIALGPEERSVSQD